MAYTNRSFTWDFDSLKRFYEKYVVKWINSAVSWTDAQKKQARANLGFGDGDAVVYTVDRDSLDVGLSDENGNVLVQFKNGNIKTKNFDSAVSVVTKDSEETTDLEISDENNNRIVIFEEGHIKTKNFDSSKVGNFDDLMDYAKVLQMPQNVVKSLVEIASEGRCTALYDDDGYPSLMYKIPKVSIGSLAPTLGELTDIHPAFKVNGADKDYICAAVFLSSLYNGHYVSWFGLPPIGRVTIPDLRVDISNKGNGWHLETIYERSLIALLTMHLNSPTPTGNTKRGISDRNTWEYCQMAGGSLPGSLTSGVGLQWINGTQPTTWSHNRQQWGIYDVMGGFHEICDLFKIEYGKIYLSSDNNFFKKGDNAATFENSWVDTGAAYDNQNSNLTLHTSVTTQNTGEYQLRDYTTVALSSDYDSLSDDIRKKLALLLLAPKLTSSDSDTVFPIAGRYGVSNKKALCYGVFGGSEEYGNANGLAAQITAYPINDNSVSGQNAHGNMGSRMFYIA